MDLQTAMERLGVGQPDASQHISLKGNALSMALNCSYLHFKPTENDYG
jgi:hypothetical protein